MIKVTKILCRLEKNQNYIEKINTSNREYFQSPNCDFHARSLKTSSQSLVDKREKMSFFKLSDYDCVGFDLDLSLVPYDINNLVRLDFELLSKFMVEHRGWDENLRGPLLDADIDFLQKGLVLDFEAGNILKISSDGLILRASHGTKFMSSDELEKVYPFRRSKKTDAFVKNPLEICKNPMSLKVLSLLDYFDMPVSLIFARAVDACNRKRETRGNYKIWPDLLDGLLSMFDAKNFKTGQSSFFSELKNHPEKYINKRSTRTIDRIRELRKTKLTFLITNSYADWVNLVATEALGVNWRELFDIVVCNAKKPGFFTDQQPFLKLFCTEESKSIDPGRLMKGEIYSQGNWKGLEEFCRRESKKDSPKCLYFGDNLIQDIYCPGAYVNCDTVVISKELQSEGMKDRSDTHCDEEIVNSKVWGSYFSDQQSTARVNTLWCEIMEKYSKLCIPSLEFIVDEDFDHRFECFEKGKQGTCGFHPTKPLSLTVP